MGIYRRLCYSVEDMFVKVISKNKDMNEIREKVHVYRQAAIEKSNIRKEVVNRRVAEQKKLKEDMKQKDKQEILALLSKVVDTESMQYTQYEFNEVKRNRHFFENLTRRVFEPGEQGLSFIFCEFDKSKKKEMQGYLIATNKRALFLTKNLQFMDKFRYQTIINVSWFRDGIIEKGLVIQYGKRRLEFDEIFDENQMNRIGNLILNMSTTR